MKQLKKITWGILLLSTVFVACNKKSKNENEIAPKSAFDGDYLLKQIKVAGQPLPETSDALVQQTISGFLLPYLDFFSQNLSDEQKKVGVYIMSEIAKGFQTYMKENPNDINPNTPISNAENREEVSTISVYELIYKKQFALDASIFENVRNALVFTIPLPVNFPLDPDILTAIKGTNPDIYLIYATEGQNIEGKVSDQDGIYFVKKKKVTFLDPFVLNDTYLPMMIRILFNHNTVKNIAQQTNNWILPEGTHPKPEQLASMITVLPSVFSSLLLTDAMNFVNTGLDFAQNGLYNGISLEFLNNTSALNLKLAGSPIYDSPAPLIFYPNSKDRFQALFSGKTPLPNLMLDFKMIKQENKTLHLGLKDVNGLTSLLNSIGTLKPKNETQRGVLSNVMNLYTKFDALLKELVKKHEHLLLNMLLEPASLKDISTYILPFLSKPRNNEVQDTSLIVLELEKND